MKLEKLNLNDKQKTDLIQTLLIVSSILVALKPVQGFLNLVFMVFIFASIIYYILIQNYKEPSIPLNFIVLVIAATFSTLLNVNLFINIWNAFVNFSPSLGMIFYLLYYILFTFILWAALVKR